MIPKINIFLRKHFKKFTILETPTQNDENPDLPSFVKTVRETLGIYEKDCELFVTHINQVPVVAHLSTSSKSSIKVFIL